MSDAFKDRRCEIYTPLADREIISAMATRKGARGANQWKALLSAVGALLIAGCDRHQGASNPAATLAADTTTTGAEEKVLNIYNWSDSIDPTVVPAFTKEYGIKVNYDVYDSIEMLETKLLAARTGYDVVFPSAPFMQRLIQAGVFQKLDKTLLPNLKNLDPGVDRIVEHCRSE